MATEPAAGTDPAPQRVLVVDDDAMVAEVVSAYLERAGIAVTRAASGVEALDRVATWAPDLVVLDLTLPDLDGLAVCQRIRVHRPALPVVILTARGDEDERVLGLQTGADDYVTKPFSPRELVLRVQSVLRRSGSGPAAAAAPTAEIIDGDLRVDPVAHRACLDGEELPLTAREFDLLAHLMANPGRAMSREELMRAVWGWEYGDQTTVTVHVRRLREKVEADPAEPVRLVTVWGVGYRWDPHGT
jgi:two-component system response regulator ResD